MSSIEMASPAPGTLEQADPGRGLGVMNWLRNTRPGQLLANVSMSAAVILPGGTAVGAALAEAPPAMAAGDEAVITDSQRQECIEAGLAKPKTLNPTGMYSAGVRPDGPVHTSQIMRGAYEFADITEVCPPELDLVRVSLGIVQMRKDGEWKRISRVGLPASVNNEGGLATIWEAPPHAFPSFVFNDYIPSKHAFHPVRIKLIKTMRDEQDRHIVASGQSILSVEVHGNGKQAMRSKRAAEKQRQERHKQASPRRPIHKIEVGRAAELGNGRNYPETYSAFSPPEVTNPPGATEPIPSDPAELKQECIEKGTARPEILQKPVMYRAGIRPGDPHHYFTQGFNSRYSLPSVPECEELNLERNMTGWTQMQMQGDRSTWVRINKNPLPGNIHNDAQLLDIDFGPPHPKPNYMFNMCDEHGFLKVRTKIAMEVDNQAGKVLDRNIYYVRAQVHGNCEEARRSANATKDMY